MDILVAIFTDYGYFTVFFILLICGFGVPIPEDITLVAGGIIAGLGFADVHTMVVVSLFGVLIGDGTMFTLGRIFGETKNRPLYLIQHYRAADSTTRDAIGVEPTASAVPIKRSS